MGEIVGDAVHRERTGCFSGSGAVDGVELERLGEAASVSKSKPYGRSGGALFRRVVAR